MNSRRRQLPDGPSALPFLWLKFLADPITTIADIARRYGDPFFLPALEGGVVVTGDSEGIRTIFQADPDTFVPYNRDDLSPILGKASLFVQAGAEHKAARKLLMPPFHGARMRVYGDVIHQLALRWIERQGTGVQFLMEDAGHEISLDVITRAIFGIGDEKRAERFRQAFLKFSTPRALLLFKPMRRDFGGIGPWAAMQRKRHRVLELIREEIVNRKDRSDAEDILSLMRAARYEDGQSLSEQELQEQLLTLVMAGHETTGTTLAWAFYWLHQCPDSLVKVRGELDSLGDSFNADALSKLPFLDAVCQETMRLFPLIPLVTRRVTRPFVLQGREVPAGTGIGAGVSLLHYNPSLYPSPELFAPERFLERTYSPFEYIPFGGGARRCIGASFATFELKIVLATIIRGFRLKLLQKKPIKARLRSVTLSPAGGIPMMVESKR